MLYFFEKIKKIPGDITTLHLCTKNIDDMIYSSRDTECNFLKLVIMGYFLPFYPLPKNLKTQNFEKMKKIAGDIIILHMCTKNYNHIRCVS